MNNIERAIEVIEDEHDPYLGPIDAPSLVYALSNAGLLAPDLVDTLIAEKRAHQKLRDEMGELVEYLNIQEGNDRPSRLYVHGQRSAMELIKDILEGE